MIKWTSAFLIIILFQSLMSAKDSKDPVQSAMQKYLKRPYFKVDTKNSPRIGEKESPITILVYNDLQCPVCIRSYYKLMKIYKDYQPLVQIRFKNYPFLPSKNTSLLSSFVLAQYSMAAHDKGKYHDFLYELFSAINENKTIDEDFISEIYEKIQLNQSSADAQMNFEEYSTEIKKDIQELEDYLNKKCELKNAGTPTIIVNNRLLSIGYNEASLKKVIDYEIFKYALRAYQKDK